MARRGGFSTTIKGLDADYLKAIEVGKRKVVHDVSKEMADELTRLAPTRKVNYQARTEATGATAEVSSSHPGAKAMSEGAFIQPKKGRVLRFTKGGETVYTRKPVRIKGNKYIKRALGKRRKMILRAVDRELGTELAKAARGTRGR
jgi:hypothetical protein